MQSCGSTDSPHSCPSWTGSPDLLHSLYCLPPFWGNLFLSYIITLLYMGDLGLIAFQIIAFYAPHAHVVHFTDCVTHSLRF